MPDQTISPGTPNPNILSKVLRIASTHYTDGATVTMEVTAHVAFSNATTSSTDSITCSMTLEVYNKGLSWATHEEVSGSSYVYQPTPTFPQYCWTAYVGAKQAWSYLKNSMNHQSTVPTAQADTNMQLEPAIAAALKVKTFIFGFTHGESSGVRASFDDGTTTSSLDDDVLSWSEVGSYVSGTVQSPRTAPPINMVIMYACSTCSGRSSTASNAFGTTANGQTIPDRAYAGFENIVWSVIDRQGQKGVLYPLHLHSNLLMSKLSSGGWTIKEALKAANDRYPPVVNNDANNETVMVFKGDPHARIDMVYLGVASDGNPNQNSWYIIL